MRSKIPFSRLVFHAYRRLPAILLIWASAKLNLPQPSLFFYFLEVVAGWLDTWRISCALRLIHRTGVSVGCRRGEAEHGRAVQVDPMRPVLEAPMVSALEGTI
jgi:hypothetical protein